MTDEQNRILDAVCKNYLNSGDFNGITVLSVAADLSDVASLIELRQVDLIRGDQHANPHIKAFAAEAADVQIRKIKEGGLAGCLYPTPEVLMARGAGADVTAPYTKALLEGVPQLEFRAFDLRILEWYRNDPRYDYEVDDIHGRINQKAGTKTVDGRVLDEGLEYLSFGFAYDAALHRAVAVFVRDLHNLAEIQQLFLFRHELSGDYNLHPEFYRTQIVGDFPEGVSIYGAFLEEKYHINRICDLIGRPKLFRSEFREYERPAHFGILIRPTSKEMREFSLLLDQLLSDDLSREFFKGEIELSEEVTKKDGTTIKLSIGTIQLLETWLRRKFRPKDPEPFDALFRDIRAVRNARQRPAHVVEDNVFDQKYVLEQHALIEKAFNVVRTIRMVLENHPKAKGYFVPDYLRDGKVWKL